MKNLTSWITSLLIVFSAIVWAQEGTNDSLIQSAIKRYPMLKVCQPDKVGEKILCGTLNVLENREVIGGRTIPIDVYLFPSYGPNPENRCYMDYAGGPGVPNTVYLTEYEKGAFTNEFRKDRDILLIDLRGTGASKLKCKAYDTLNVDTRARIYDPDTAKECRNELQHTADLSQYNTANAVEDLNEVLEWLKVEQLDFCGGSYGTRIGVEWARRYPSRAASLILLGTVPPDFGLSNFADQEIEKQIQKLQQRCKSDKSCNDRFPDFVQKMQALAERLDKNPIQYDFVVDSSAAPIPVQMDGDHFRSMIAQQFAKGNELHRIPIWVEEADKGNFFPLIKKSTGSLIVHPVEWCQFCTEEPYTRFDPEYRNTALQFFTKGIYAIQDTEVCKTWGIQTYPDWLDKELQLEMPVLLMTGENDVLTPPRMAEKIVAVSPNSRHIVFAGQGHFLNDWDCWKQIMLQFLENYDLAGLMVDCSAEYRQPSFITDFK
ncbi:alpha/beta fold hydrolase [Poritiphilus flavus]|uniref:Alpha/beta fold hydrolase n=1 Tax=Poritiphilus flavus TaxID=2697053 RepID=A0A6L9EEA4_9FLAO|nr:alpha/beta fold hydrolase [Poritiphilus flavus]NAS12922.1 alpha/beta fold hydrolase [Poritiphilus flavus]